MKRTFSSDLTSKAIRKRYARVLDLKNFPEDIAEKRPLRGPIRVLILVIALVVFWMSFVLFSRGFNESISAVQENAPRRPSGPPAAEISNAAEAVARQPEDRIPDNPGFAENSGEPAVSDKPPGSESATLEQQPVRVADLPPNSTMDSESVYVVYLSTKSKDEAIQRAKTLNDGGYPGEVILSSTGFFGVVQRYRSYEQAKIAMKAFTGSGAMKEKPYIMKPDRVIEIIYPKTD